MASRGRAFGLLHLAAGTSKVFWLGLLLTIMFAILAGIQGRQAGGELAKSSVLMLGVFFTGMFCCGILTLSAAWISWRSRVKLWVDSSSYLATLRGEWPPQDWTGNRCSRICVYSMVPVTAFIIFLIVPLLFLWSMLGGGPEVAGLAIGLAAPIVGGIVYLVGVEKLVQIVAARSPQECWPELVNSDEIDESDHMIE